MMRTRLIVLALLILTLSNTSLSLGQLTPSYVEGEVFVRFRPTVPAATTRRSVQARGLSFKKEFKWLSHRRGQTYALVSSDTRTTAQLMSDLQNDPGIEDVCPNTRRSIYGPQHPADSLFTNLWGLHNTGQSVEGDPGTIDADLDFPEAWGLTRMTNTEVIIGILDTGIDYNHPDLIANLWINPLENPTNGIDDDGNGYVDDYYGYDFAGDEGPVSHDSDPMDRNPLSGHGTHVSGTAAAAPNNAMGVVGVQYNAKIMTLKVSDNGTNIVDSAAVSAIEYASQMRTSGYNIVVLNASYGGPSFNFAARAAIQEAGLEGIIFCAAAGNDSADNDVTPNYPANYNLANIISVAASDGDDHLASFSNYGDNSVELAAPGTNILSTYPTHILSDANVTTTSSVLDANGFLFAGMTMGITGTVYDCGFGHATSFPIEVSGQIALIERGPTNPPGTALEFTAKTSNAMVAGASAVIIYNHSPGSYGGTLQYPQRWVPAVSLSQEDGQLLLSQGTTTVTVVNQPDQNTAYEYLYGTSMATPHVAGAVALMALNYPNESATQRIARLLNNVDVTAGLLGDVITDGRLNIRKAIDTDGDDLPDWWEMQFTNDLAVMHATTDLDEDSFIDLHEFLAGTDATNDTDLLRFQQITNITAAGDVIQWPSKANRSYMVKRATTSTSEYTVIQAGIEATPTDNVYTDTTASALGTAFYQVQVE